MALVSVVIPNFNHARFLQRRIKSVLAQTHRDIEVILLDDASDDGSNDIIAQYVHHPLVTAVALNVENSRSPFRQWNAGAGLADGEYLWFAESDDVAEPTLVETLVRQMERYPTAGIAYVASELIDERDEPIGSLDSFYADVGPARWQADYFAHGTDECQHYLCIRNTIPNASAVLIRRSAFVRVGGADESFVMCGDWKLYTSILQHYDIAYVAQPLNGFRQHARTVRQLKRDVALVESVRVMRYIAATFHISPEVRQQAVQRLARYWLWLAYSGSVSLRAHHEAIRVAKEIDPHIELRLAQAAPAIAARRIRRWRSRGLQNSRQIEA